MKKFLKILVFFFSFCFIGSIHAYTMPNGLEINQEYIQNLWNTYLKDKNPHDLDPYCSLNYESCSNIYGNSSTPFDFVYVGQTSNGITNIFFARFIDEIIFGTNGNNYTTFYFSSSNVQYNNDFNDLQYEHYPEIFIDRNGNVSASYYNGSTEVTFANGSSITNYSSVYNYSHFALNFDLVQNGNILKEKNFDYTTTPKEYYARIHLNGGVYSNILDLNPIIYTEDFDTPVFTDIVAASEYFYSLINGTVGEPKVGKNFGLVGMKYDGIYFDPNFKHEFIYNSAEDIQRLSEEHNLYVKWRYDSYDSLIQNEALNNMTFDTNYSYMYITHQNSSDVYIGLPFNNMLVSSYGYDSETNTYNQETAIGLTPLFEKEGYYYYILRNDDRFDNWVMVVEKNSFPTNNYNFKITNNAYITYGNDLTEAEININGSIVNTNISDVFGSAKDKYLNSSNDLISTLKNIVGNNKNLINNFTIVFNKIKTTELWNYFMILIVGTCIIMIIKTANRK